METMKVMFPFLIMLVVNNCINIDAIIFDSDFQIVIERAEEYERQSFCSFIKIDTMFEK